MVSRKEKVFQFYLLSVHCFHLFGCMKKGEIRLAYITASEYRPGTVHKNLPGARVSGAITYAVEQINNDASILPNHNLSFEIAETFGQGLESVRLTSELAVSGRVDAFIGPVFNCSDEARIAAAFNLPMISYVSVVYVSVFVEFTVSLITCLEHEQSSVHSSSTGQTLCVDLTSLTRIARRASFVTDLL